MVPSSEAFRKHSSGFPNLSQLRMLPLFKTYPPGFCFGRLRHLRNAGEGARTDANSMLSVSLLKKAQQIEKPAKQIKDLAKG
jgi:hypothetical protein